MIDLSTLQSGDELVYAGRASCCTPGKVYKVFMFNGEPCIDCDEMRNLDSPHQLTTHNISDFTRFIQQQGGWIGVDLDGTLAHYDGWKGPYDIGPPIGPMLERVKAWLEAGRDVRIFTARVTEATHNNDGTEHNMEKVVAAIQDWCLQHVGQVLRITNVKDWNLMELWDDRAVQVRPNTGQTLADELEAIKSADSGKAATP